MTARHAPHVFVGPHPGAPCNPLTRCDHGYYANKCPECGS